MANGTLFFSSEWKLRLGNKADDLIAALEALMTNSFGIKCGFNVAGSDLGGKEVSINLYDIGGLDPQVAGDLMYELKDAVVQFSWLNGRLINQEEVFVSLSNSTLVV